MLLPTVGSGEAAYLPHDLGIGRQAALGARAPGEAVNHQVSSVAAHAARSVRVAKQFREALTQLARLAWLDEKARHAVLYYLGQTAEPTTDYGRTTGHRLQYNKPE